jgi:uncharacterized membrane protein YdjX (TVP38/TMEM64 family)
VHVPNGAADGRADMREVTSAMESAWPRALVRARWIVVGVVLIAVVTAAAVLLPLQQWVDAFATWVEALGVSGMLIFALVYIVAVVALFPASLLTVAAGVAFGLWAVPLVIASAATGATLAFLLSRYLFRERVQRWARRRPELAAVDEAVRANGWKVVGLLRLSPLVPFNLQNYFFGVTRIALLPYVLATTVGIVPGTVLYVAIGVVGRATVGSGRLDVTRIVLLVVGLLATIGVVVLVARKANEELRRAGLAWRRS